jgi:hypothetical protein
LVRVTTNALKTEIVSRLVLAFEQGNIKMPDDEVLLGELEAFECTPLAGGQFRYSAPAGMHDDLVLALSIAWAGLGKARKRQLEMTIPWGAANDDLTLANGWRPDDGASHLARPRWGRP